MDGVAGLGETCSNVAVKRRSDLPLVDRLGGGRRADRVVDTHAEEQRERYADRTEHTPYDETSDRHSQAGGGPE
ncbi:MAG: hypothetical protein RhofKO_32010 [Rhodothermales bacterium]